MNSPFDRVSKVHTEGSFSCENTKDMSPVTDLALNMKCLTTTLTGTPNRRISWSDPFPYREGVSCLGEYSPCTDSPMLQEILRKNTVKVKRVVSRKILPLDSCDKENVPPKEAMRCESVISSETDSISINDSQDSGYSSTRGKNMSLVSPHSSPYITVKSSVFDNMTSEGFDGSLFLMEDDIGTEVTSGLNVNSLLTKPLCNLDTPDNIVRRGKLPTRRCLTLEMENSDSSPMIDLTKSNLQISTMEVDSDKNTDFLPVRKYSFKRPDLSNAFSLQSKRRKSSPTVNVSEEIIGINNFIKQRSFSETAATIMQAVQISDLKPDLIGDCSRCYALPVVKGRHQDLKSISAETLVELLKGEFIQNIDSYTLIDCRYPYEFEGGHILGAENIYTKDDIMQKFLKNIPEQASKRHIIIFHCEFSSERAPNLCRFLRNKDRELNECSYPKLYHPEIYLLEGGYKTFFANFREYCEPRDYKPMNHKDHSTDLRLFRSKSKSWGSDSKSWHKMKSSTSSDNV